MGKREGAITTHDEIRLLGDKKNPGWARANSRLYIVEGTGAYEGGTCTHAPARLLFQ